MSATDNAAIVTAASELVTLINTAPADTFSAAPQSFTAVRRYRPVYELKNITALQVLVLPAGIDMTVQTRVASSMDISLSIAVQRPLQDPDNVQDVDTMLLLVQQMLRFVHKRDLPSGLKWRESSNEPAYWPGHLRKFALFTSVLSVSYMGMFKSGGGSS